MTVHARPAMNRTCSVIAADDGGAGPTAVRPAGLRHCVPGRQQQGGQDHALLAPWNPRRHVIDANRERPEQAKRLRGRQSLPRNAAALRDR